MFVYLFIYLCESMFSLILFDFRAVVFFVIENDDVVGSYYFFFSLSDYFQLLGHIWVCF